ncbi:carbohydrate ABC transporter permease [Thermanaerovibrio acidaminovorans]|uniref:carbohydrate ABC transporter permease n=1 Tax=Thermanaerovibrio acidaminovorans TaxID=81462 RepID=UPI0024914B8E|nr:carbohydrate ABC transporter permease [Thermanaerovibrio acidaminovorans]
MDLLMRTLGHILLWGFSLAFLLPLLWTLRSALLPEGLAYALPPAFGPLTLENFALLLKGPFGRAFWNSLTVASLVVLLGLPLAAGLGYAMARYRLGGHGLRFVVLATQMIPPIVLALPFFALFRSLDLAGSLGGLVLAYLAFVLPFMAWLLMGFFQNFPRELEEAALVDGASPYLAFLRVVLPLSLPGLFAAGVMGFLIS